MEIIIFLGGLFCGFAVTTIVFKLSQKSSKSMTNELINQMQLQFENTANRIFKESSEEFSNVNKEKVEQLIEKFKENNENLSNTNKERLEDFFAKFKEKIEDFEKRTEKKFDDETVKFTRFDENIKSFLEAGNKISQNTNSLISVMKSDNRTQGHWGEIVLERVLEASNLRRDEEFLIQKSAGDGRPDAIVLLPEKRCVMIDSKTSFSSWYEYLNAEDDEIRMEKLKEFKDSTKTHIQGLTKRDYSFYEDYTACEYILMFIPIESCYSLMFCEDCTLWEYAWKNNIMPVSPSTLLATLKIINSMLVVDKQNNNALEISRLCSKMLDKFADMLKDLLGARKTMDNALKKLQGKDNILTNIEKIKTLGCTMSKDIPELPEDINEE